MNRRSRSLVLIAGGGAAVLALTGCRAALAPTNPVTAASFTINQIAAQPGAAFTVVGQVVGGVKDKEIVSSSFNFSPPVGGPPSPLPGTVTMYSNTGGTWNPTTVVPTSAGITSPNEPTIADVNRDGRNDIIVPSGYFFSVASNLPTGSITWWENNGDGTFTRHDVITGIKGAYHRAIYVDFDNDGKKDIVTSYEDGGFPAWPFAGPPIAPQTRLEFFKGDGAGNFAAPVKLADGAGSLPVVFDINGDGKLDVATAQYWKTKTNPIPPFGIGNESFVWYEQGSDGVAGLTNADFTKHIIATGLGESFQILPVDNIDGTGRYGAIGVNHTNPALGPPGSTATPQVVRLTPGADVTQPWTVSQVATFTPNDSRPGQAAPGSTSDGDVDGDGDVDLVTAGDSDWGVYWLERKGDGSWVKHNLATEFGIPGTNWGQASTAIADLDSNGTNEIVFSSYNAGGVFVATRVAGTGGSFPASPHIPDPLLRY